MGFTIRNHANSKFVLRLVLIVFSSMLDDHLVLFPQEVEMRSRYSGHRMIGLAE